MEKPSTISNHSPTDFAYTSCLCITDDSVYSLTSCAYEDLNGIIYFSHTTSFQYNLLDLAANQDKMAMRKTLTLPPKFSILQE